MLLSDWWTQFSALALSPPGRFYGWAVRAAARGPAVMGAPRSGAANVLY